MTQPLPQDAHEVHIQALPIELERVRGNVAVIGEQVHGEQNLSSQRWSDHEAVHDKDGEALDKALVRTETAIGAASDSHRREHEIEKAAKDAADATHQTQHQALNELRDVVGDLTGQYVRNDTLGALSDNWERRWTELQKATQEYRDSIAKEQASYRESQTKQELDYRAQQAAEIRSLRESRSLTEGHHGGTDAVWGYVAAAIGMSAGIAAVIALIIKVSGK